MTRTDPTNSERTRTARSRFGFYARVPVAVICIAALAASLGLLAPTDAEAPNAKGRASSSFATPQISDNSADVLWRLAQQCASDLASDSSCRSYTKNEKQEYVIIKDNDSAKPQGYLLIPVLRVAGIEGTQVFSAPVLDLWESAWLWSEKYPGKPAPRTALAINSMTGRTQNQLHIHISCVLPEVAKTLARKKIPASPGGPVPLKLGPHQNTYWAATVSTLEGRNSPFEIVRSMAQVNKKKMKDQSILVVGSQKGDRYYILDTTADGTNPGQAEELLDQTCGGK